MKQEIKKQLVSDALARPDKVSVRGSEDVSKGGNVIINTSEPTVVSKTSTEQENRGSRAVIVDTSTVNNTSRSTVNVERVEPKATIEDTSETKEIESGLKGNRDAPMSISYTKASGKKVYRAKLK